MSLLNIIQSVMERNGKYRTRSTVLNDVEALDPGHQKRDFSSARG
jgi:hypothetical protein